MKRVTRKVRAVKSSRAREHLVFTSDTHRKDREAADRLRKAQTVLVFSDEEVKRDPFPNDRNFAAQAIKNPEGKFVLAGPEDFTQALEKADKDSSEWYVEGSKKVDGRIYTFKQKRKGQGLRDCYFNFPPWVTEELARMAESGKAREARLIAMKVVARAARELETRTGYRVAGVALHPDSRQSLGFHIQYQTAADGKLLGRSATKTRGRKGLRLIGDAWFALARFCQFLGFDEAREKMITRKDYDDLAIDRTMNETLKSLFAPEVWDQIQARGREYSENWQKRRQERLDDERSLRELEKVIELKEEHLRASIAKIEDTTAKLNAAEASLSSSDKLMQEIDGAFTAKDELIQALRNDLESSNSLVANLRKELTGEILKNKELKLKIKRYRSINLPQDIN